MAEKCSELFQRKLELDQETQQLNEDLARINGIRASRVPSDAEFEKAQKVADDAKVQADSREDAAYNMNQQKASDELRAADGKPGRPSPAVNIYEGQPVNYRQALKNNPEEVVVDYAALTETLRKAGAAGMPEDFAAKGFTNPKKQADIMRTLSNRADVRTWLNILADAGDRITGLVGDVVVVRYMHDTAKDVYMDGISNLRMWALSNPGKAPTPEMKRKIFNQFKVALMAQRHYDFIRSSWGKIGNKLQGASVSDGLLEYGDDALMSEAVEEAAADIGKASSSADIAKAGEMQPTDIEPGTPIAEVFEAIDKLQTNPDEAMEQLNFSLQNIMQENLDPKMAKAGEGAFYRRLRKMNLMTKDWQLFNENTNSLNLVSNQTMSIYGPTRQFLMDWDEFAETAGVSTNRAAIEAWEVNFRGVGQAMYALRDAGREVFMDAFKDGKALYASNVDTYGRFNENVENLIADLEDMQKPGLRKGTGNIAEKTLSAFNADRHGRWFHATVRLFMYEKTGKSFWLRPGLRTMGAVDNIAGFANTAYKLRHDLEVKYRRGAELDQTTIDTLGEDFRTLSAEEQQIRLNDQIMKEFKEYFYDVQPTEEMRKQFRDETGITPELLDDLKVDDMIAEQRVGYKMLSPAEESGQGLMQRGVNRLTGKPDMQGPRQQIPTYGGMVKGPDRPLTKDALDYSAEMRFANLPGKPGGFVRNAYRAVDSVRRNPLAETQFPYFRAPFLGAGFDQDLLGVMPGLQLIFNRNMTKVERRRAKATLQMAGAVWAMWGTASLTGNIVGNGPTAIPGDTESFKRREAWLLDLKRQGKKPNTIMGVQLLGGFPIINTMFLMEDLKNALVWSVNPYDQYNALEAVTGVLVGHLSRSTALGQIDQLMQVINGDPYQTDRLSKIAGYVAGGRYLPSGPMRSIERATKSRQSDLYRDADWSEEDFDIYGRDWKNQMALFERKAKNMAYDVSGLTGMISGGQYKDKAWFGAPIRMPWGMTAQTYLKNRFDPVIIDEGKIYGELKRLGLLSRPEELITRRLRDVPMTDDMQKLWNDTYGEIVPPDGDGPYGISPAKITVNMPVYDITDKSGRRFKSDANIISLDLAMKLNEHTVDENGKGRTFIEAARSFYESDLYQRMEGNDNTKYDENSPPGVKRQQPAFVMMKALKRYYARLTTAKMLTMEDPPAFVSEWRRMHEIKQANLSTMVLQEAGQEGTAEKTRARLEALSGILKEQ